MTNDGNGPVASGDPLIHDGDGPIYEAERMTRPEALQALLKRPLVILPIGATEQHGPHLPLGTDTFMAAGVARRLAARTGALLFPALPVGYSWVWRDIPGTLVIDEATLQQVIKDIAHNLHRQGVRMLILLNGHGANESAMKYAVRELADEVSMKVLYFSYFNHFGETEKQVIQSPKWHGMVHACEVETSLLLAVKPELCHMDRAVREYPAVPPTYGVSALSLGSLSDSGVYGDATLATAEKGERLIQAAVDRIAGIIEAAWKEV